MGIWGAICSVASSVCSAVSSLCSGIGGAVMRGVSALAPTLAPHIFGICGSSFHFSRVVYRQT